MSQALTSTLYRSLLRSAKQISALSRPESSSHVNQALHQLSEHLDVKADDLVSPVHRMVSKMFREAQIDSSSKSIDDAFYAMRKMSEIEHWLQVNTSLHALAADTNVAAEEGATVLADAMLNSSTSCRDSVAAALDGIARSVMESEAMVDAQRRDCRLHKLTALNAVLFDQYCFAGDYSDLEACSNLRTVLLDTRKGLPIMLCILYQAVAARCSIPLAFTNFPHQMLLRLESLSDEGRPAGEQARQQSPTAGEAAAIDPFGLSGLWVADYDSHGPQVVRVSTRSDDWSQQGKDGQCMHNPGGQGAKSGIACYVEAVKLTGDSFVPAGELTWRVQVPTELTATSGTIDDGCRLPASVQVADRGFANPRLMPAEIELIRGRGEGASSLTSLIVHMSHGTLLHFSRCDDRSLWFIDPFAAGKLLPRATCHALLRQGGIPTVDREGWLAPCEPQRVWARVCRNLALYHRRNGGVYGGSAHSAQFWEGAAAGLDPADSM